VGLLVVFFFSPPTFCYAGTALFRSIGNSFVKGIIWDHLSKRPKNHENLGVKFGGGIANGANKTLFRSSVLKIGNAPFYWIFRTFKEYRFDPGKKSFVEGSLLG